MPPFNPIEEKNEEKEPVQDVQDHPVDESHSFWKTPVVIILVCLLLLGILVPFKIIPRSVAGLTSFFQKHFSSQKESISADKTAITSGGFVTLNLNSTSSTIAPETYTLMYECHPGVNLDYSQSGSDFDRTTIPCETPFTFTSKNKQLTLRVVSQATSTVEQPISIDIEPDPSLGTSTERTHLGDISLYVLPSTDTGTASSTPPRSDFFYTENTATTTLIVVPPHAQENVQAPDLHVSLLKIGKNVNGVLNETTAFQSYDAVVIQFSISNSGGKSRGGWRFEATAPTIDPAKRLTYSPLQRALTAGSGSINTLTIGGLMPGAQTISIIIDRLGVSGDADQSNNRIDIPITIY